LSSFEDAFWSSLHGRLAALRTPTGAEHISGAFAGDVWQVNSAVGLHTPATHVNMGTAGCIGGRQRAVHFECGEAKPKPSGHGTIGAPSMLRGNLQLFVFCCDACFSLVENPSFSNASAN
jgi:hypothetical protein